MNFVNYHSHSIFSDGKDLPEAYVEYALAKQIPIIGFSDHAPLPFECDWTMPREKLGEYLHQINLLKEKHQEALEIYLGLEIDYIPNTRPVSEYLSFKEKLDYSIGAVHFVEEFPDGTPWSIDGGTNVFKFGLNQIFNQNIKLAVSRYYSLIREMVDLTRPNITAHLDRIKQNNRVQRFFDESAPWYRREIEETLDTIKRNHVILEINTKKVNKIGKEQLYPSPWVIELAFQRNIPIHLASDAHNAYYITEGFQETINIIWEIGYREVIILQNGEWKFVPISPEKGYILSS